ncbi:DHS-like NAD/FAD-binding domain-containing protein, partial [Gyrodon lividus]
VTGAGISVAAGIPDFRSKQNVPGFPELGKKMMKEMFQLSMITASDMSQRPLFGRFSGSLSQKTEDSEPTPFHMFLKKLDDRGTLLRVYTQNIDDMSSRQSPVLQMHPPTWKVHQLCHAVEAMKPHHEELVHGSFSFCSTCQRQQDSRRDTGKWLQSVPTMVPDVVLYDMEHPDGQQIMEFQIQDLSGAQPMDLLLVVGTGMHVIGTQRMIKEFSQQVHLNRS